jgi:hypothetical protein
MVRLRKDVIALLVDYTVDPAGEEHTGDFSGRRLEWVQR